MKYSKAIFFILFIVSSFHLPHSQTSSIHDYKADKIKKELYKKLNIRMVTIEETNFKDTLKPLMKFIKEFYDREGNLTKQETYFHNYLSLSNITEYDYDDLGNITEVSVNGLIINRYEYDENSNCIESIYNDVFGEINYRFIRKYDNQNNLICLSKYNKDDSLYFESTYINNYVIVNGQTRIKSIFRENSRTEFDYDAIGDTISISEYSGKLKNYNYTWSKDLMKIEIREYISDTLTFLSIANVDSEKRILKITDFRNNTETSNDSLIYDENKNLIRSFGIRMGKKFESVYNYDKNGNEILNIYRPENDSFCSCTKREYNSINLVSEVNIFQPLNQLIKEIRYIYSFY